MRPIKLVVSDVDGTLLTDDKRLTDAAIAAVQKLSQAGIGFTLVSSRPTVGMNFLIRPLSLALPFGSFNGSSIVEPPSRPLEQHFIPAETARNAIGLLDQYGADVWLFTSGQWLTRNPEGDYVGHEQRAIKHAPTVIDSFAPYLDSACKIVGASADADLLIRCETAMRKAVGPRATAVRSQTYYLDVTPPGRDKGTFVAAIAERLGIRLDEVATLGDMQNDLPMFAVSGLSFAMGNASDEVKECATHVTASNEQDGFARAIEKILAG